MAAKVRHINGIWWVVVHHQGRRRKKRVGKDKRLAEQVARQIQARLVLGDFEMGVPEDQPIPFDKFAGQWLRSQVLLPRQRGLAEAVAHNTARSREQSARVHLVPYFGDQDIRALRVGDVQRFFDHCLETGRPGGQRSIEIVLGVLRLIFAHAQSQDLIPSNPVDAWKTVRGRRKGAGLQPIDRTKVLSAEEVGDLLSVARAEFLDFFPLILLLADTGCRIGEALALRWSDLDLVAGTVRIERSVDHAGRLGLTKTRRGRVVELSTRLREVLTDFQPDICPDEMLMFPSESGTLMLSGNFRSRVFRRLVRRTFGAGRSLTPHALRHHADSWIMPTSRRWKPGRRGLAAITLELESA